MRSSADCSMEENANVAQLTTLLCRGNDYLPEEFLKIKKKLMRHQTLFCINKMIVFPIEYYIGISPVML